jgi:hypothetical protein
LVCPAWPILAKASNARRTANVFIPESFQCTLAPITRLSKHNSSGTKTRWGESLPGTASSPRPSPPKEEEREGYGADCKLGTVTPH